MDLLNCLTFARHGCLRFAPEGGPVVYIDPFQLTGNPMDADIIVVTHPHSDHFSPVDIRRIAKKDTEFVSTQPVLEMLQSEMGKPGRRTHLLSDGLPPLRLGGVIIRALPAQNKNHPLGFGFGVLLTLDGVRYYISGDTDILSDVPCDVMFVVCDGIYNMPDYETKVPEQLKGFENQPKLIVPYHYAEYIEGTDGNGEKLAAALQKAGWQTRLVIKT